MLHQVDHIDLRVIDHRHAGVDDLGEVVGGNVGRHTNGNAGGAVYQKVGETAGQHPGLFPGLVEVGVPVDRIFVNIPEHLIGELRHSCLGVAVSSGGVAVHGAEVAVTVHQHIAHGKVLGKTDHGVVNRAVAMGMVLTKHVTDAGGGLLKGLVGCQTAFIHSIKDAAVDGLQTVTDVRQGTTHDNAHAVLNVCLLHLHHKI